MIQYIDAQRRVATVLLIALPLVSCDSLNSELPSREGAKKLAENYLAAEDNGCAQVASISPKFEKDFLTDDRANSATADPAYREVHRVLDWAETSIARKGDVFELMPPPKRYRTDPPEAGHDRVRRFRVRSEGADFPPVYLADTDVTRTEYSGGSSRISREHRVNVAYCAHAYDEVTILDVQSGRSRQEAVITFTATSRLTDLERQAQRLGLYPRTYDRGNFKPGTPQKRKISYLWMENTGWRVHRGHESGES